MEPRTRDRESPKTMVKHRMTRSLLSTDSVYISRNGKKPGYYLLAELIDNSIQAFHGMNRPEDLLNPTVLVAVYHPP